MSHHYDVVALKSKQDKLTERENKLILAATTLRNALLRRLEEFATDAIKAGLRGVKPLKILTDNADFTEATISLNGFDLVIASTNDALQLNSDGKVLASKTFIYLAGSDENPPFIEIIVQEGSSDDFRHEIVAWTTKGRHPICSGFASDEEGAEGAELLLGFLYQFERGWHECPALGALRLRKHATKPLGFVPS